MPILRLSDLTWEEVQRLDRGSVVVLLPVGAVEAHGPHLPLTTDGVIAEGMARTAAERLDRAVLLLPPLPYTTAGYAAGFAGTISVQPGTVSALIVDIARSLSQHGFRTLALVNAHLDPAHLASLHVAVARIREENLLAVAFPDLTQKPWVLRLTEEFKSGACHAGQFEGSIVLAERPDLVREEIRAALPPNPVSLSTAIRAGRSTFEEAGGLRAYFGSPAAATAEEGRRTLQTLGGILVDSLAPYLV